MCREPSACPVANNVLAFPSEAIEVTLLAACVGNSCEETVAVFVSDVHGVASGIPHLYT